MIIGFDFDNTLVEYDALFFEAASNAGLIPNSLAKTKNAVKTHLIENNQEEKFTKLQAFVYGELIKKAHPKKSLIEFLKNLKNAGHELLIISHKTEIPYSGENYNLRGAALSWLQHNDFVGAADSFVNAQNIFFENSLDQKIDQIHARKCDIYFDDLPDVLKKLNKDVIGYLYDPKNSHELYNGHLRFKDWKQMEGLIAYAQ